MKGPLLGITQSDLLVVANFMASFIFFLLEWFNKKDRVDALTVGLEKTKVFRLFITFL